MDTDSGEKRLHNRNVSSPNAAVTIEGIGQDGRPFRPSDWCQRLAAAATINCSYCTELRGRVINPYVKIVIEDGIYSLRIATILQEIDSPLYDFMLKFARNNGLQIYMP